MSYGDSGRTGATATADLNPCRSTPLIFSQALRDFQGENGASSWSLALRDHDAAHLLRTQCGMVQPEPGELIHYALEEGSSEHSAVRRT